MTKLYNERFEDHHDKLLNAKKNNLNHKFIFINLKLKYYDYDEWFIEEELDDKTLEGDKKETDILPIPPLEGDEEFVDTEPMPLLQGDKEEAKKKKG